MTNAVFGIAQKFGVARASRKYNSVRSSIWFWLSRCDGTIESLADRSIRPHSHPNQHTEAERKLMREMRRRNPRMGLINLWGLYLHHNGVLQSAQRCGGSVSIVSIKNSMNSAASGLSEVDSVEIV